MISKFQKLFLFLLIGLFSISCAEKLNIKYDTDVDIGADLDADAGSDAKADDTFKQNAKVFSRKMDILWVIDNSGSMNIHQRNLANNFDSYIQPLLDKNIDFNMAVATTEAFESMYTDVEWYKDSVDHSLLRNGSHVEGESGVVIMNNKTPNLNEVFRKNILQGIRGNGDERALQSIRAVLSDERNINFRRPGSLLNIIIVTDEDDFSYDGASVFKYKDGLISGDSDYMNDLSALYPIYNAPDIESVDVTLDYLKELTSDSEEDVNFSISSIVIDNKECHDKFSALGMLWSGQSPGKRLMDATERSNGVVASICNNMGYNLRKVLKNNLELVTMFKISKKAQVDTIEVYIDDVLIQKNNVEGWSYNETNQMISFHGNAIPKDQASIKVKFTPIENE